MWLISKMSSGDSQYAVFSHALTHGVEYLDDSFVTVEEFQVLFPILQLREAESR